MFIESRCFHFFSFWNFQFAVRNFAWYHSNWNLLSIDQNYLSFVVSRSAPDTVQIHNYVFNFFLLTYYLCGLPYCFTFLYLSTSYTHSASLFTSYQLFIVSKNVDHISSKFIHFWFLSKQLSLFFFLKFGSHGI